ncbi:MAG: FRG domain-containing protein [Dehalococcoidia bacterium]|nr:FRG domain-containing protein [Dehalococcoidia bacterium]
MNKDMNIYIWEYDDFFRYLLRFQRGEMVKFDGGKEEWFNINSGKSRYDRLIFRGQGAGWKLENTLERACKKAGIEESDNCDIYDIENEIVREFRRLYNGIDRDLVCQDTLYCLSLMRHYGAPTRLIDFDYSVYVAAYFALECANNMPCNNRIRSCAIWCINTELFEKIDKKLHWYLLWRKIKRDTTDARDDVSFKEIYINNNRPFIGRENPIKVHERLHLQHGLFLCPSSGINSFHDSLVKFDEDEKTNAIYKIQFSMTEDIVQSMLEEFRRMNISRESLFPGLDGFALSTNYHILHYKRQFESRTNP